MAVLTERRPVSAEARGIARRDIQKLRERVGAMSEDDAAPFRLYRLAKAALAPKFGRNSRLTETEVKVLRNSIDDFITKHFDPIAEWKTRARLIGMEDVVSDIHGYAYLQVGDYRLIKGTGDLDFKETNIEVRYTRFTVDRKRLVIDDMASCVSFNSHVLGRLVERGRIMNPLEVIRENVFSILPYVALYCATPEWTNHVKSIAIPFGDGLLMGEFAVVLDQQTIECYHRRRLKADRSGFGLRSIPVPDTIVGPDSLQSYVPTVRLSTFLDHDVLRPDQEWLRDRFREFMTRHEEHAPALHGMLMAPETLYTSSFYKEFAPMYREFCGILIDPRADLLELDA